MDVDHVLAGIADYLRSRDHRARLGSYEWGPHGGKACIINWPSGVYMITIQVQNTIAKCTLYNTKGYGTTRVQGTIIYRMFNLADESSLSDIDRTINEWYSSWKIQC